MEMDLHTYYDFDCLFHENTTDLLAQLQFQEEDRFEIGSYSSPELCVFVCQKSEL